MIPSAQILAYNELYFYNKKFDFFKRIESRKINERHSHERQVPKSEKFLVSIETDIFRFALSSFVSSLRSHSIHSFFTLVATPILSPFKINQKI